MAKAGRVEHARHADDHVVRQAGEFAQRPDHGIERVGDADHEGVGCVRLEAVADRFHHLEVDADEVVARHSRLAGDTGGDDADIGSGDIGVGIGAFQRGIEAFGGAGLRDVQRFALRRALSDVEEGDVAKFLDGGEVGECAADLPGADEGDLGSGH